jgi:ribonuclease T2
MEHARSRSIARGRRTRGAVLGLLAALALGAGGGPAAARHHGHAKSTPRHFDYYVLALTWTPGFCATHRDPVECGHGLGFGLHGLWPQYEGHGYPQNCSHAAIPAPVKAKYEGIYPSPSMMDHEWPKHGTCSGLDPAGYFELSDKYRKQVVIPPAYATARTIGSNEVPALKKALLQANPGLPADGLQTSVANGILTEIRVCLTKEGAFRSCSGS